MFFSFFILGDPTIFGNFKPHERVVQAVTDAIKSGDYNGYGPSFGHANAREAVANYLSKREAEVTASVSTVNLNSSYLTNSKFCKAFKDF